MFVVGTAGHVDHGKSTLVKALTGIDPDRLREEQERAMTIDLGFAWLTLPSGREISLIDVPGHERFIKNMLAGVGGIDVVLLVIAADESVMPQTREHMAICQLLQVKKGLTVLTKIDTVDRDFVDLVEVEVHDFLKGTFLADAPVLRVSAQTGEGVPDLVAALRQLAATVVPRDASQIFSWGGGRWLRRSVGRRQDRRGDPRRFDLVRELVEMVRFGVVLRRCELRFPARPVEHAHASRAKVEMIRPEPRIEPRSFHLIQEIVERLCVLVLYRQLHQVQSGLPAHPLMG